jgi:subtilisin family serine protease
MTNRQVNLKSEICCLLIRKKHKLKKGGHMFLRSLSIVAMMISAFQVTAAPLKNPFEMQNEKWLVKEASFSRSLSTEVPVSSVRKVSVLIDKICWTKQTHARWLSEQIQINPRGSSEQSFAIMMDPKRSDFLSDSCVHGVGNYKMLALHDADPMSKEQRHLDILGAVDFADDLINGKLKSVVTLAIIDTGLDFSHPEFSYLWTNDAEAKGTSGVDDDKNGYVDDVHGYNFVDKLGDPSHQTSNDHGSHVAGLAAASLGNGIGGAGIMGKNLKLMVLNVVGTHWDEVDLTDVERAIRYAADNGADVINISSGGLGELPTLAAAIVYAINKGATVVVSAGNAHLNIDENFSSPASYAKDYPGLIAVSATDTNNRQLCSFSNFGDQNIKVSAPGCDSSAPKTGLLSTLRKNTYGYKKGTSMSAPLVSGAVALIYASLKDKGEVPVPANVEKILMSGSTGGLDLRSLRKKLAQ